MNRFIVLNAIDVLLSGSHIYSGMLQDVGYKEALYYFVRLSFGYSHFSEKYSERKFEEWKNLKRKRERARLFDENPGYADLSASLTLVGV